ncbi:MAG: cupredoxin domain-containing protein [Sneathiella sp.]|nr:cupredoxin domain-containing protein [Sneathiella sp.]
MTKKIAILACAAALTLLASGPLRAENAEVIILTIKDHQFQPDRIEVEAGKGFTLLVKNEDDTPEEFESHDLRREKVIKGHSEAKVKIKALEPGEYKFVGEFNEDTAKGVIVVK